MKKKIFSRLEWKNEDVGNNSRIIFFNQLCIIFQTQIFRNYIGQKYYLWVSFRKFNCIEKICFVEKIRTFVICVRVLSSLFKIVIQNWHRYLRYSKKSKKVCHLDGCDWARCSNDSADNFSHGSFIAMILGTVYIAYRSWNTIRTRDINFPIKHKIFPYILSSSEWSLCNYITQNVNVKWYKCKF